MTYIVYDPSIPTTQYHFDKSMGKGIEDISVENVENRLELRTFGRFPYVYYAGQTDYVIFDLTTVFIRDEETDKSAREQVDEFKAMIKKRKILIVENGQGQSFKCDVQITSERSPKLYADRDLEYIEVGIKCTQIDI